MNEPPRPFPRPVRVLWASLLLSIVAACGGGGGGGLTEDPASEPPPDGITGRVLLRDYHLGRIAEDEPNDTSAQPGLLPPVAGQTRLEVAGTLGVSAARLGRADPVDVLRFQALEAQDVALQVEFAVFDPVGGQPNDVLVEVRSVPGGALVASSGGGGTPQAVAFPVLPDVPVDVVVRIRSGHAWYVAGFVATDPPVAPAPTKSVSVVGPGDAPGAVVSCAPGHVLVRVAEGVDPAAVAARAGLVLGAATGSGSWRFRYPEAAPPAGAVPKAASAAKALRADPDVLWSEPDWIVRPLALPSDPDFPRQWHLQAIAAEPAWAVTQGAEDVVVAVVDTGITAHPDLQGQTVPGYDFITDPDMAGDEDGRDPDPTDVGDQSDSGGLSKWHGTYVSSIVAGRHGDGSAGAGVAPGCRVMPLRAIGIQGGLVSDVAAAILYAASIGDAGLGQRLAAPVKVINLSIGLDTYSHELEDACNRAANMGCLLVGAAGNSGGPVQYPAAFDSVFAVGAVGQGLTRAWYSCIGPAIDLVAPGGDSRDDQGGDGWPDGVLGSLYDQTVYPRVASAGFRDGTSGAAPQVAAAAALLWSLDPTLTVIEVRNYLTASAIDRGIPGRDDAYGHGLLQVMEAVRRAASDMGTPVTSPPQLHLLQPSLRFQGLEASKTVLVTNGGGGLLSVAYAEGLADDGGTWLRATPVPGPSGAASDVAAVTVTVDRTELPSAAGRWSGTIRLSGPSAPLGALRIVVYVQDRQHAGVEFPVVVQDPVTGYAPARARASAQTGYRYWFRGLPAGTWNVWAGEDLDADGFTCEAAEACGWHGGRTELDALPVTPVAGTATTGVDVVLYAPTPP